MTKKIKSPKELAALRDRAREEIDLRSGTKEMQITVHMGTCGIAAGARNVMAAFLTELEKSAKDRASLRQSGCAGLCDREPMVTVSDRTGQQFRYGQLDAKKVHRLVQEHVVGGKPVVDFLIAE